jgi:hypothetical protein
MKPSRKASTRLIRHLFGRVADWFSLLDYLCSNKKYQILNETLQLQTSPLKIALVASYPKNIEDLNCILGLVKCLEGEGFYTLIVNNNKQIVFPANVNSITRKNIGFDLAAHREALSILNLNGTSDLLLINDSVFWDIERLNCILRDIADSVEENTIYSLTESYQVKHHVQSFFLYFKKVNPRDILAVTSWKNVKFKRTAVRFGEMKILESAYERKISLVVRFPIDEIVKRYLKDNKRDDDYNRILYLHQKKVNLNPTQHFWNALFQLGFPGYKKDLILRNPAKLSEIPVDSSLKDTTSGKGK